ncbi:MAG TPA: hypothetical protein P5567_05055 [Kiritimatiellia bacterium]|nr:hypothetical protein [Kiritimatiellia bacterium]HRZ11806.1 hypothetical protein [Kiritimatiellia bacterium]HSA17388.1 hypothetical protein [Kiritimatiellia bacterium]
MPTLSRMQERIAQRPSLVDALRQIAAGLLAAATGILLLLFLVSSLYGGFKMATPLGSLSCRHPGPLLLWTALCAGVWALMSRPATRGEDDAAPPFSRAGAIGLLLAATALLWLRFLYRSYEPVFGHRPVPTVPFLFTHLLFLFSGLAALGVWRQLRRTEAEPAALFAALFTALSPLWFHVSAPVVAGYAAIALLWWGAPRLERAPGWLLATALIPVAAAVLRHWGWAGNRLTDQFAAAAPGLCAWLLLPGLAGWWFSRRTRRPWMRAALLACAWSVVCAGARGEAGSLGAVLGLPLIASLLAVGGGWLLSAVPAERGWLARNVIMICLAGILLGMVRDGLDRSIRSPFAPPLPGPEAPAAASEPEEAPE